MADLESIDLKGNPYNIGLLHGKLLADPIKEFLSNNHAHVNTLRSNPLTDIQLKDIIQEHRIIIEKFCPDLFTEIIGISDGAGITMEEAILLQIRRELIGINSFTLTGDCSSFGIKRDDRQIVGQTIDLNGDMTKLGNVFRIYPDSKEKPSILMYSFAGLLGYMGMNSFGLAVAINMVVSDGWKVGVPPYLLVREFLNCSTVNECIEVISRIPRSSSRSFTISDLNRQVTLELTSNEYRIIEDSELFHTNHYLHPDFISQDKMNIFSRNSSIKRLQILNEKMNNGDLSLNHIESVFQDHSLFPVGICAHSRSNIHLNDTVASVVMYPKDNFLYASKGKACESSFKKFSLM